MSSGSSRRSKTTDSDEQIQEAVSDVIRGSNDKVVEIRPANESGGRGKFSLLLLVGGILAVGYWLQKSRNPTEKLQRMMSETSERTREVTDQAAQTIEEGGETVAERVEEGSERASEEVQQTGEEAAETAERAGQKVTEKTEQGSSFDDSSSG